MNTILIAIDREIETVEAGLGQCETGTQAHTEALAFRDGLRAARSIAASHMARWFNRKLTPEDTQAIRDRIQRGEKQADLATEYGVSASMISKIGNRTRG